LDEDERRAAVDRVLGDSPAIHHVTLEDVAADRPAGVQSTTASCYRFLAKHCPPGTRTLETGAGLSTILFIEWGCDHTCITPTASEVAAISDYLSERGVSLARAHFEIDSSDNVLGRRGSDGTPLDLVFIDGCHGFPLPIIDWHYAAGRLGEGGIVVLDDAHLPAVKLLAAYLKSDPRWRRMGGGPTWSAYQRLSSGSLAEDWYLQPFYRFRARGLHQIGPIERAVTERIRRFVPRSKANTR
jgi:predicted O-methyltransferase YrrM